MIRRDGAQKLTLDAVAAESGVSKGGVLYHFATKRALVDGLLERWLDDFDRRLEAAGDDVLASTSAARTSATRTPTSPPRSSGCSPG